MISLEKAKELIRVRKFLIIQNWYFEIDNKIETRCNNGDYNKLEFVISLKKEYLDQEFYNKEINDLVKRYEDGGWIVSLKEEKDNFIIGLKSKNDP